MALISQATNGKNKREVHFYTKTKLIFRNTGIRQRTWHAESKMRQRTLSKNVFQRY